MRSDVGTDVGNSAGNDAPARTTGLVYVALGSNLGDRAQHLADARTRMANVEGVTTLASSVIEETAPLGPVPQGAYLNQMVMVHTTLTPHAFLAVLQRIEHDGGRERTVHWGPRTIDLDIVLWPGVHLREPELSIPHPAIAQRDFWQRELAELGAPGFAVDPDVVPSSFPHQPSS
jgi:2-amino-4-hydroxy-6-hydroxymethyldihydropteridine diphosphokinase